MIDEAIQGHVVPRTLLRYVVEPPRVIPLLLLLDCLTIQQFSKQWKYCSLIVPTIHFVELVYLWANGNQYWFVPKCLQICQIIDRNSSGVLAYHDSKKTPFISLLGGSLALFIFDLYNTFQLAFTDEEHAYHMRCAILYFDFVSLVTFFLLSFPSISDSIFNITLCNDMNGDTWSLLSWAEYVLWLPTSTYLTISYNCMKSKFTTIDVILLASSICSAVSSFLFVISENKEFANYYLSLASIAILVSLLFMIVNPIYEYYTLKRISCVSGSKHEIVKHIIIAQVAYTNLICTMVFVAVYILLLCLRFLKYIVDDYSGTITFASGVGMTLRLMNNVIMTELQGLPLHPLNYALLIETVSNERNRGESNILLHKLREIINVFTLGHSTASESQDSSQMALVSQNIVNNNISFPEAIEAIHEGIKFMTSTVNNVVSMSEIETGSIRLVEAPFYIVSVIKTVAMSLRGQLRSKKLLLCARIESSVPAEVIGDRSKIEHVLMNLVSNAIKFSDVGTKIQIIVSYNDYLKDQLLFAVKDNGSGIPYEYQPSIFKRYVQINAARSQGGAGTGVGLNISREIILIHGGDLKFVSKPDLNPTNESGSPSTESDSSRSSPAYPNGFPDYLKIIGHGTVFYFHLHLKIVPSIRRFHDELLLSSLNASPRVDTVENINRLLEQETTFNNIISGLQSVSKVLVNFGQKNVNGVDAKLRELHICLQSQLSWDTDIFKIFSLFISHTYKSKRMKLAYFSGSRQCRAMIVDSDYGSRSILSVYLQSHNISCDACNDADSSIAMLKRQRVDYYYVVFVNATLGALSGGQLIEDMRACGFAGLIVGMSGNVMDKDYEAFKKSPADLFLSKPLDTEKLSKFLMDNSFANISFDENDDDNSRVLEYQILNAGS